MVYIAKLARRLARLRTDVNFAGMISLLFLAACAAGEPTSSTDSGNTSGTIDESRTLIVSPRAVMLEGSQGVRFAAYESLVPGSAEVTAIEWTATGGSIGTDGSYTSAGVGEFKVIGRKRRNGAAHNPPADTAVVIVVPPQPTVIAMHMLPEDASVPAYARVQFEAIGQLSDGTGVPIGVSWMATGGSIDAGGLYTAGNESGTYKVIATHASTGYADTVPVVVTSSLTSLRISPTSSSVPMGGGQQYSVTGLMSDGTTAPVSGVRYSTNGGTISTGGFYTATTPGSYTVNARVTTVMGSTLTTSSTVSVSGSAPSASSAGHPNEPSGFTPIAENNFSGATLAASAVRGEWGGPWYGTSNFVTQLSDPSAPNGTGKVAATVWPSGLVAGNSPTMLNGWDRRSSGFTDNGRYRKLYVSMRVKIPQQDFENQNTGTKIWYLAHGNLKQQNADYLYLEGTYNGTAVMDRMKVAMSISSADEAVSPGSRPYRQNVDTRALLTAGSWHHVEVYMEQGTVGSSDGTLRVWVNGVRVTDYTRQVKFLDSAYDFTQGFYDFQWTPVWGGTGGTKSRSDRMYMSSLYISGSN